MFRTLRERASSSPRAESHGERRVMARLRERAASAQWSVAGHPTLLAIRFAFLSEVFQRQRLRIAVGGSEGVWTASATSKDCGHAKRVQPKAGGVGRSVDPKGGPKARSR